MMMNRLSRKCLLVLALAVCLIGATSDFARASYDEEVPANVGSFLSLRDYPQFMEKLNNTPMADLLEEPEVKKFVDGLMGTVNKQLDQVLQKTGIDLKEVPDLLTGEVAMVSSMGQFGGSQMGGHVLLLAEVGPNEGQAVEMLKKALSYAEEQNDTEVSTEQFRGQTIYKMEPKSGQPAMAAVTVANGEIAATFGPDTSMLEKHLVLMGGGDMESLADSDLYNRAMNALGAEGDFVNYRNWQQLFEQMRTQQQGSAGPAFLQNEQLWNSLGINGLKATATVSEMSQEASISRAVYLIPAPRRGIMKALDPRGGGIDTPAFVDDNAAMYVGAYFNVQTLWDEAMTIMKQLYPQQHGQLTQQLQNPNMPVDIENDVIRSMGDTWYVYVPQEALSPNPPKMVNFVISATLENSANLEQAFNVLRQRGGGQLQESSFRGKTIYSTPPLPLTAFPPVRQMMGQQGQNPQQTPMIQPSFVFLPDKVLFAGSMAMAKKCIQNDARGSSPLMGLQQVERVEQKLDGQPQAMAYVDWPTVGQWMWPLAQKLAGAMSQQGMQIPELPGFDTLKPYLAPSVGMSKWTDEGLITYGRTPYPSPKK